MGSWRPVLLAASVALAAWALVVLGVLESPGAVDRVERAFGVRGDQVVAMTMVDGDRVLTAKRTSGGFVDADGRPLDPVVLEALLTALEYTHARRRRSESRPSTRSLEVSLIGGGRRQFGLGDVVGDGALVWVSIGDGARLVTALESRQVFPPLEVVRERRVFRDPETGVRKLLVTRGGETTRIEGDPLVVHVAGAEHRVDPDRLSRFLIELSDLELLVGEVSTASPGVAIELANATGVSKLELIGRCDVHRLAVTTQLGPGCIDARAFADVLTFLAGRVRPFAARGVLDPARRAKRAQLRIDSDAIEIDPAGDGGVAAARWLDRLAMTRVEAPATPPVRATATIEYDRGAADEIEFGLGDGAVWARRVGASVAWQLDAEVLEVSPVSFLSPRLLDRDRFEIREVRIRRRGREVIHRRGDGGTIEPPLGRDVTEALAHLEATRLVSAQAEPAHRLAKPRMVIEVLFDPPPIASAEPNTLVLEFGGRTAPGCYAREGRTGLVFIAARALCALAP